MGRSRIKVETWTGVNVGAWTETGTQTWTRARAGKEVGEGREVWAGANIKIIRSR